MGKLKDTQSTAFELSDFTLFLEEIQGYLILGLIQLCFRVLLK
jgi:hypothetical protein